MKQAPELKDTHEDEEKNGFSEDVVFCMLIRLNQPWKSTAAACACCISKLFSFWNRVMLLVCMHVVHAAPQSFVLVLEQLLLAWLYACCRAHFAIEWSWIGQTDFSPHVPVVAHRRVRLPPQLQAVSTLSFNRLEFSHSPHVCTCCCCCPQVSETATTAAGGVNPVIRASTLGLVAAAVGGE